MLLNKRIIHVSFNAGNFKLAWIKPAGKRKIMYSRKRLNAIAWHPRLLFVSTGTSLSVYALPDGPIKPDTQVYIAPYDNLGKGQLCFGNVERPKQIRDLDDYISRNERSFMFGEFTHEHYLKDWKLRIKKDLKVDVTKLKKHVTIKNLFNS